MFSLSIPMTLKSKVYNIGGRISLKDNKTITLIKEKSKVSDIIRSIGSLNSISDGDLGKKGVLEDSINDDTMI